MIAMAMSLLLGLIGKVAFLQYIDELRECKCVVLDSNLAGY